MTIENWDAKILDIFRMKSHSDNNEKINNKNKIK